MYKIVRRDGNKLVSQGQLNDSKGNPIEDFVVTYSTNWFAEAPDYLAKFGYHLLVFETMDDVHEFCRINLGFEDDRNTYEVWLVEVEEWTPNRPFLFDISRKGMEKTMRTIPPNYHGNSYWPHGTKMYKKVKLVEHLETICPTKL